MASIFLWQWFKLYFWKLHKKSVLLVKTFFILLLFFFAAFFKIRTPILNKIGHYSAFFWHIYSTMHPYWLLMSLKKLKKNENFRKLWNFDFVIFFRFVSCLIWIEELSNDWITWHSARLFVWHWHSRCILISGRELINFF